MDGDWNEDQWPAARGPVVLMAARRWQAAMVMAVAAVAILAVAKAMEDVCVRICVGTAVGIQIGINIS